MEFLADRFLLLDREGARADANDGRVPSAPVSSAGLTRREALDVASGAKVTIVESSAGGPSEQLQWSRRCERFVAWHHPHLAALLDFGLIGEGRRFEAWRGSGSWQGDPESVAVARASGDAYLRACNLEPCREATVVPWAGGPAIIPDATAGREAKASPPAVEPIRQFYPFGIESIPSRAVQALAELLDAPSRQEPRALALLGEPGSGIGVALRALARQARLNGFIPIDSVTSDASVWTLAQDRSVLIIDRNGGACGWRRWLDATCRRGRGHVLVLATHEPPPRVHSVRLEPLRTEVLVDAVRPQSWLATRRPFVQRAALLAQGNPARFAASLWIRERHVGTKRMVTAAAERPPHYAVGQAPSASARPPQRAWPVSGDVAALRHKLSAALDRLPGGRLAALEREVRGLVSALVRRRDLASAAAGCATLADALIRRGRTPEARRVLDDAREWAEHGADEAVLGALSLATAALHLHRGALGEADATARSVLAAATARNQPSQALKASVLLSRILFWLGRYAEAMDVIHRVDDGRCSDREVVMLSVSGSRAALALGRGGAHAATARALASAEGSGNAWLLAHALGAGALLNLVEGDLGAVRRDVARGVTQARRAHDPLLALRLRLLGAEAARRDGQVAPATRLLARVARLPKTSLAVSVAARLTLLRELMGGATPEAAAAKAVANTGLQALALFAPRPTRSAVAEPQVDEVLDLLTRIQGAVDDETALVTVCQGLRTRMDAAAVGFIATEGASLRVVASDGPRLDLTTARRAIELEQLVTSRPPSSGAEAAVPIRYAGRTLGAVVARWMTGANPADERVSALLRIGSAIAGPAVVAMARGQTTNAADEILGVSEGIAAIRLAVERAASIPYPVLVEGESGSGKELVARALHKRGCRRDRPFVAVNCAAIPDDLMEAELFGHAKGAFTGAMIERAGVFEEAHGGTLFLDEVGELSPRAQAKLLRTLQEGEVRRVGENVSRRVDVRVVAATNRNLRHEVTQGRFRLDLLYRLDVVRITVPPLRERLPDLPMLIERCWREATARVQSRAVLSAATLAALARHTWPGNVRELQNVMASLAVRVPRRGVVTPSALPWASTDETSTGLRLDEARRSFEEQFVRAALVRTGGHRGRAASELGLSRQGLTKILLRLSIGEASVDPDDGRR